MAAASPGGASGVEDHDGEGGLHDLQAEMEDVLANDGSMVLAVFNVFKLKKAQDFTGTQLLKALGAKSFLAGRTAPQPRVLCLTVKRSRRDHAFKPFLKLCKASDAASKGYKVSKSFPLRQIAELRLPPAKQHHTGADGQKLKVLEIRVPASGALATIAAGGSIGADSGAEADAAGRAGAGVAGSQDLNLQLGVSDETTLQTVLGLMVQLIRQCSLQPPKLVGVSKDELDKWWASNQQALLQSLGELAQEVLSGPAGSVSGAGAGVQPSGGSATGAAMAVLMSAKEERDLGELLELFAMGYGDVAEFEARLQEEHDALEDANVESVLENVPFVDSVVFQMRKVQGMLEDLDENLVVLDAKLRHMREDIAAIEASNNTLERQARNNNRLLHTLQDIISDLRVSRDVADVLESPAFDTDRPSSIVKAAWALHAQQQRLRPGFPTSLSPHLLHLRVVAEARDRLEGLATRFVAKASSHLAAALNQAVEEHVAEAKRKDKSDRAIRLLAPDHAHLRAVCQRYRELVRVVRELDESCMAKLEQVYSQAVNMLLRKELRIISSELRKAAQLDMSTNKVDYSLTKEAGAGKAVGVATSTLSGNSDEIGSQASEAFGHGGGGGGGPLRAPGSVMSRNSAATSAYTASVRLTATRVKGGALEGLSLAIPLNEAYQLLLETVIPFLLDEAEAAASFLVLYADASGGKDGSGGKQEKAGKGGKGKGRRAATGDEGGGLDQRQQGEQQQQQQALRPEGPAFLAAFLQGVDTEFYVLVDLTAKGQQQQIMCLPMLAVTSHWMAQLAPRPIAAVLTRTLAGCHERLRASLAAFVGHQMAAVEAYVTKASGGVKALHVLAFTSQFAIMATHVETLLAQAAAEGIGMSPEQRGLQQQQQGSIRDGVSGSGRLVSGDGGGEEEETRERVAAGVDWDVRAEVDKVYEQLVGQMFATLEAMAAMDAKHGERLRMENYTYFCESVRPLVRHAATLGPFLEQAEARGDESTSAYVQQQLEWGKFWKMLEFSARVDQLLQVVGPSEVGFQPGCSASEVRSLISSTMKDADRKLQKMFARVRKHLGTSSLAFKAWGRIQEQLLMRYRRLEEQVGQCYGGAVAVSPTPEGLGALVERAAAGGG